LVLHQNAAETFDALFRIRQQRGDTVERRLSSFAQINQIVISATVREDRARHADGHETRVAVRFKVLVVNGATSFLVNSAWANIDPSSNHTVGLTIHFVSRGVNVAIQ
jgi:hypothetical protein